MTFFGPQLGSGFGEPGGTLPPRISRSIPPRRLENKLLKWEEEMTVSSVK